MVESKPERPSTSLLATRISIAENVMPTLGGIQYRMKMIGDALSKPFSEIKVYPHSSTGLFDFLAPLLPELPSIPMELERPDLPDDPGAAITESSEPEVSRTLYTLARLLTAGRIAEVGVFRGATSRYLARALAEQGGGTLHLVDMSREALTRASQAAGHAENLTVRTHEALSTDPKMLAEISSDLDLIFLDADHSEAGVRAELAAWLPKLRDGGIVAIHDTVEMAGVCKAAHEYAGKLPLVTITTGRGSGLTLIRQAR